MRVATFAAMLLACAAHGPARAASIGFSRVDTLPGAPTLLAKRWGAERRQIATVMRGAGGGRRPAVVVLHGYHFPSSAGVGVGWLGALLARGVTIVTIDPGNATGDQIRAIARAAAGGLAQLRDPAFGIAIDPDRIVLLGDGADAAPVALLATDLSIMAEAHLPATAIRAVVLTDGEGVDADRLLERVGGRFRAATAKVFGAEPTARTGNSAASHAGTPNLSPIFIAAPVQRSPVSEDMRAFAAMLRAAGSTVIEQGGRGPVRASAFRNSLDDPTVATLQSFIMGSLSGGTADVSAQRK